MRHYHQSSFGLVAPIVDQVVNEGEQNECLDAKDWQ